MGMSCFLVQNCMHFTKVSCFSVHFCSRPSQITWFTYKFAYMCVILCVGGAWGVWQFLWRVDVCMQIYGVFWEPFMGMSDFIVFSESRLWECRVLQCFRTAVYGNVVFFRRILRSNSQCNSLCKFPVLFLIGFANLGMLVTLFECLRNIFSR